MRSRSSPLRSCYFSARSTPPRLKTMTKAMPMKRVTGNDLDTIVKTLREVHGLLSVGSSICRQYGRTPTMQAVLGYQANDTRTAPLTRSPRRTRVVVSATKSRTSIVEILCAFGCTCLGIAIITVLGAGIAGLIANSSNLKDVASCVALVRSVCGPCPKVAYCAQIQ